MIDNLTSPIPPTFMSTELIEPSPLDPLCICFLHPNDAEKLIKKYPDFDQAVVATEFIQEGTSIVFPRDEAVRWFLDHGYGNLTDYSFVDYEDMENQIIKAFIEEFK